MFMICFLFPAYSGNRNGPQGTRSMTTATDQPDDTLDPIFADRLLDALRNALPMGHEDDPEAEADR